MLNAFTLFHVALSLVGIGAGFVVVAGLLSSRQADGWTKIFLSTTLATSVTGFFFPFHGFTPAYAVGAVSVGVLAVAILARYRYRYVGGWRPAYVVATVISFYLNFFVLIAQSFMKVPALKVLAPTQSEPPFQVTQGVALVLFVGVGVLAVKNFRGSAGPKGTGPMPASGSSLTGA